MAESNPTQELNPTPEDQPPVTNEGTTKKSAWTESRPKKDSIYYEELRKKYEQFTNGTDLLTIQEAFDSVNVRIISLLTADIKSRSLTGVSRETMEEALKSLNITAKILARRTRALWDLLMASEEEARKLAGTVLTSKILWLQTEYMGTRRTNVTVHGVPIDISEDHLGAFFAQYGKIEKVATVMSKAGI